MSEAIKVGLLCLFVFSPVMVAWLVGDWDIAWFTFGTALVVAAAGG